MSGFPARLLLFLVGTSCLLPFGLPLEGRYTNNIHQYDLVVPRKLTDGGNFLTWSLAHYFPNERDAEIRRKRGDAPTVSYGIVVDGKDHHVDLWPNHQLLAPDAVVETRAAKLSDIKLRRFRRDLCHYVGTVRGVNPSSVAISTCNGLTGYVNLRGKRYYIEPLNEHQPNKRGQHLHVVYPEYMPTHFVGPRCGTNQNWTEVWRKRLLDKEMQRAKTRNEGEDSETEPVKRGLHSKHRYLESMLVVDKKFINHHKDTDMEMYILTIMNMVSDYYHDASIANQIEVVVVRIMYLDKEEEEMDLEIGQNAENTLNAFCKWQQTVNPKDPSPNHHDIAVLLTRHDLCSDNMTNCGLMGLAFLGGACTPHEACAINEDDGLILGMVVAHEIGHLLGADHDTEDVSGCKPQAEDKSYYVMSPYVHMDMNVWSSCSKAFVSTFFNTDLGECLNDEPEESLYKENNMLPGTVYDGKAQCDMIFPGSDLCQTESETFCENLRCLTKPKICSWKSEPPADGTKCGENKWCINMHCVEIGERPKAVNGGWGSWGSFGDCSRSCGAGVQYSERECNNPTPANKGRYCLGERRKIKTCNTQPCSPDSPGFRAAQCTEFEKKPFQDKMVKWKPHKVPDEPCSLYCLNDENVFAKLAPRAKDGTPCKSGTRNMCVSGVCQKVGCDFVIDSDAVEDECGVCKGDGTECKIVDKVFTEVGQGYTKVVALPKGVRNILFEELKPSMNTMAVGSPDEKTIILNANNTETQKMEMEFGGAEGIYSHPEPNQELLVIHGPLKENIVLFVVFYRNTNEGFRYKYAEPHKSNYQPTYNWEFIDWGECDVHCGGGVETSEPKCIDSKVGLVTSSFCQQADKPALKTRKCNEKPCRTKWRVGKWGKCIACQNLSGMRVRDVECVRESAHRGADDTLVEDSECSEKKPGIKELCTSEKKCRQNSKLQSEDEDEQLPETMMRRVWLQTVPQVHDADVMLPLLLSDMKNPNKKYRDVRQFHSKRTEDSEDSPACETPTTCKPAKKVEIQVGAIVKDPIDPEQLKIIETPLKESRNEYNLTDEAFETLGDQLTDTIDEEHQKVYTKEEAANIMNNLAHGKCTDMDR